MFVFLKLDLFLWYVFTVCFSKHISDYFVIIIRIMKTVFGLTAPLYLSWLFQWHSST